MEAGVTLFLEEKFQRGFRDRENAAGIGDNSAETGDGTAGIVDIAAIVIPC